MANIMEPLIAGAVFKIGLITLDASNKYGKRYTNVRYVDLSKRVTND